MGLERGLQVRRRRRLALAVSQVVWEGQLGPDEAGEVPGRGNARTKGAWRRRERRWTAKEKKGVKDALHVPRPALYIPSQSRTALTSCLSVSSPPEEPHRGKVARRAAPWAVCGGFITLTSYNAGGLVADEVHPSRQSASPGVRARGREDTAATPGQGERG